MKHYTPLHHSLRLLLALLALLGTAASAPATRAARQPSPAEVGPAVTIAETEPANNDVATADFLDLASGPATAFGKIDSVFDAAIAAGGGRA
jgi:hypothetical protein